jgi:HAE1 family hydrophobic/amphiphilic exporter-1
MADRTTGFTSLFIRRPVLAVVINVLIFVGGLAALQNVEIRELPSVERPVVSISTTYDGAAPETVDSEITAEIESAAARVPGVESISSTSSLGRSRVTVEFSESVDIDVAASDMRDAVSRIQGRLPDEADDPRVVKADTDGDAIMRLSATSDTVDIDTLTALVEDDISDRIAAVEGVADVQIYGDRESIVSVDIDADRLASRGLTVADLNAVMEDADLDSPAGTLTSGSQNLVVRADARVSTAAEIEALLINATTRVGDVATVTIGPDEGASGMRSGGRAGVGLGVVRQAGSNSLTISEGVTAAVEELRASLPAGVQLTISSDDSIFISGALHEVIVGIAVAICAVIAIIYLFLLNVRATLIPTLAIPVALVGSIAGIYLMGFSINILTLLALVLATGLVVDDAIIVLENIVRYRQQGMGARAAAVVGTREMFFAVIATTSTLAAVFIPISFLPGQAGGLFREFGFVLAICVLLSSVTALTLTPMAASRLLASSSMRPPRFLWPVLALGRALAAIYRTLLHAALSAPAVVLVVVGLVSALAFATYRSLPNELAPAEDRGAVMLRINGPQSVSLDYMTEQMTTIEALIQPYIDSGEATGSFSIIGLGSSTNNGMIGLTLAPWNDRARSQGEIVSEINALVSGVPGVRANAFQSNSLGIRGGGQGLRFALTGPSYDDLSIAAGALQTAIEDTGRFGRVQLDYNTTQPQLSVTIDRERAADLGISINQLAVTLQTMLDGREVGELAFDDTNIPIKLVNTSHPINDPTDLQNIFIKTDDGRMVPVSSIASVSERAIAPSLGRESQLRAVPMTVQLQEGMALGTAMSEVEDLAAETLPPGIGVLPLGEAATLQETTSGVAVTFGFAIVIVLLVLAAQFESFISAAVIILTVPFGLAAAVMAIAITGGSLNLYSQIGLVLLVGIMAKNGILIVEFANELRNRGRSVRQAVEEAANLRLRPVAMTTIATVLGGVPLVIATGAGAESRAALGWIVVGGLGVSTLGTLFLTPVVYLVLAGFSKPHADEVARFDRELADAERMAHAPAE